MRTKDYARGFAAGLDATVSAARVTLDELANEVDGFDVEAERELMKRVAAKVLAGLLCAVRQIKVLEDL